MTRKNKIKIISFTFAVSFVLYTYICMVFMPKDVNDAGGANYYRGRGFLNEPVQNSLDIIVFGNSDVYMGFSPNRLYIDYGYSSYASGESAQTIERINPLLKLAIKNQKPKIAVLDVDCLYYNQSIYLASTEFYFSPITFNWRWKRLKAKDFYTLPDRRNNSDTSKGYIISDKVVSVTNTNYMGDCNSKPKAISNKNLRRLNKFVRICRNNGIEVVFIDIPSADWNYAKHNYISNYSRQNGIVFKDYNIPDADYSVDFSTDFKDKGNHFNTFGAEKLTISFGKFLRQNYSAKLTDKRGDAKYAYWKKSSDNYLNQIKKIHSAGIK